MNNKNPLTWWLFSIIGAFFIFTGLKGIVTHDLTLVSKRANLQHLTGQEAVTRGWLSAVVGGCIAGASVIMLRQLYTTSSLPTGKTADFSREAW